MTKKFTKNILNNLNIQYNKHIDSKLNPIQPKTIKKHKIVGCALKHSVSDTHSKSNDSNSDKIPPKTVPNQKPVRFKFKDANSDLDTHIHTDSNSNKRETLYSQHGYQQGVEMKRFGQRINSHSQKLDSHSQKLDSHSNKCKDSHSNEKKILNSKHGYEQRVRTIINILIILNALIMMFYDILGEKMLESIYNKACVVKNKKLNTSNSF